MTKVRKAGGNSKVVSVPLCFPPGILELLVVDVFLISFAYVCWVLEELVAQYLPSPHTFCKVAATRVSLPL